MARPKTKGDPIQVRLSLGAYEAAKERADRNDETLNQWATRVLENALTETRTRAQPARSDQVEPRWKS